MKRQRIGTTTSPRVYHQDLLHAISTFLPRRGLPLHSDDSRVRWTDRLLVVTALLLSWQSASRLKDAFEDVWHVVTGMYPTRRRVGHTYEGFIKALARRSPQLLPIVLEALRRAVRTVAGPHWTLEGWVVMGVDGSRVECPRTRANEAAFGCAGKAKTRPQLAVTTVLHVGMGLIWDWRGGGGTEAERTHLRAMLATLPPQCLLLADAGFTGYDLLAALLDGGHAFVIRVGSNVRLLRALGFAVREHDGIVYLWPAAERHRQPLVLRLVTVNDGRKAVHLLTSVLERSALTDRQVAAMYRHRWGLEVFYRSLKRTLEKHTLHSVTPAHARLELDWALAGLWMLGLLATERIGRRGVAPMGWSVAQAVRVLRRVMAGRGGRRAARDLRALGTALRDSYRRRGPKAARAWPHKKRDRPPGAPQIRVANPAERQAAERFRREKPAA